jgi:thymidylate synthase
VLFISYYISKYKDDSVDGKTIYGGYGPRLFRMRRNGKRINQVQNVISLLKQKPDTRRAVVQLFDAEDISEVFRKEVPCTCTLQFLIRNRRLHLITNMRSNDAFLGLPHDVFAFTMLQEIIARRLGIELGTYKHVVGSLHLYDAHVAEAQDFLSEGWHEPVPMPPMPIGNPDTAVRELLRCEAAIRTGRDVSKEVLERTGYWADLTRLLQIYRYGVDRRPELIPALKAKMSSNYYNIYIQKRQRLRPAKPTPEQLPLRFSGEGGPLAAEQS